MLFEIFKLAAAAVAGGVVTWGIHRYRQHRIYTRLANLIRCALSDYASDISKLSADLEKPGHHLIDFRPNTDFVESQVGALSFLPVIMAQRVLVAHHHVKGLKSLVSEINEEHKRLRQEKAGVERPRMEEISIALDRTWQEVNFIARDLGSLKPRRHFLS